MSVNGLISDSISSIKRDRSTRLYVTILSTCIQMYRVGEKSLYTHTVHTITEHSSSCCQSTFPSEDDKEMIIRAWCVTVNNVRPP